VRLEDSTETALVTGPNGQPEYAGTGATLYQVVLHEIGHAPGLADTSDPNSVMYYSLGANNPTLDGTDRAAIQAAYGPPPSATSTALMLQEIARMYYSLGANGQLQNANGTPAIPAAQGSSSSDPPTGLPALSRTGSGPQTASASLYADTPPPTIALPPAMLH